jgi:hypothetical protein
MIREDDPSNHVGPLEILEGSFDSIYDITEYRSDNKVGTDVMAEHRRMLERRGSLLIPVTLAFAKEENLRRLGSSK